MIQALNIISKIIAMYSTQNLFCKSLNDVVFIGTKAILEILSSTSAARLSEISEFARNFKLIADGNFENFGHEILLKTPEI